MSATHSRAIGIDLGGTRIKGLLLDASSGEILAEQSRPTLTGSGINGQPPWFPSVRELLSGLEVEAGAPCPVGLCAPGIASPDGRCIRHMPGTLSDLNDFDWTAQLDRTERIPILNDAQAALLGEVWLGAAQGANNVFMLTLGTGVGGAAIVDGRLLKGANGRAGHLGHISVDQHGQPDICNTPGSLEGAIGNRSIISRSQGRYATTLDLLEAVEADDFLAWNIWQDSLKALAVSIASLINVLDPEIVIVGGGIAVASERLFGRLGEMLADVEWRLDGQSVPVVPAELGTQAGAVGAAWNALQQDG